MPRNMCLLTPQINVLTLNNLNVSLLLYDGVCSPIHAINLDVMHDGALMLIHALMWNDWRCVFIFAHNDGCVRWLMMIICHKDHHGFQTWWYFFIIIINEGFPYVNQCIRKMELIFSSWMLDDVKHAYVKDVCEDVCAKVEAHNEFIDVSIIMDVSIVQKFLMQLLLSYLEYVFGDFSLTYDADAGASSNYFGGCGLSFAYNMSTPCSWSGDILINSWFHKFILYDVHWMSIYMKGSQPWHVALKWCTCNHKFMWDALWDLEENAHVMLLSFMIKGENGQCIVALYGVCCVSWIKFQPLHFALYIAISTEFLNQGICGIRVFKFWENFNHRACQVLTIMLMYWSPCDLTHTSIFVRVGMCSIFISILLK